MTGATGFIGSYLVLELIAAGYEVVGLSRSEAGAKMLSSKGAQAFLGDVNDLERLRVGADTADAVVHASFNYDFSNTRQHSEEAVTLWKVMALA